MVLDFSNTQLNYTVNLVIYIYIFVGHFVSNQTSLIFPPQIKSFSMIDFFSFHIIGTAEIMIGSFVVVYLPKPESGLRITADQVRA